MYQSCLRLSFIEFVMSHRFFSLKTLCAQLYSIEINRWTSKWLEHIHTHTHDMYARTDWEQNVHKKRKEIPTMKGKKRTAFELFNWIKIQQKQKKLHNTYTRAGFVYNFIKSDNLLIFFEAFGTAQILPSFFRRVCVGLVAMY